MAPGRGRNNLRSNMVSISTNETPQLPPIVPAQSPLFSTSLPGRSVATLTSEANSDTSLENVVTNSTIPAPTDNESLVEKTRGRGKAKGFEVKKRMKGGNKIDGVVIVKGKYLPTGLAEKIFKMELGIITRLLAPLHVFLLERHA